MSGNQTIEQVRAAAADPLNQFIIVKATQGKGYVSSLWPTSKEAAGEKYLGAYHYAEPPQSVTDEMNHYLSTMEPNTGDLLCIDVEFWDGVANGREAMTAEEEAALATWVLDAADDLHLRTSGRALIYTNWLWVPRIRRGCTVEQWDRLVEYPCWLAENAEPGKHEPIDPKPGSSKGWPVLMHQYKVDTLDRDWTPDINALAQYAVK